MCASGQPGIQGPHPAQRGAVLGWADQHRGGIMSNTDHRIATALRELADRAAPPRIRVDAAWRAGRRRRRAAITSMAGAGAAVVAALTVGLITGLPGPPDRHQSASRGGSAARSSTRRRDHWLAQRT